MKTRSILFIVVALSLLWGCARHIEPDSNGGPQVTITASVEDSSKVDIAQGESCLALSWAAGDALRVVGNTSEVYTIDQGFTAHKASFTGTKVEGSNFTVFCPGTYASEEAIMARSYLNQVQKGNGSTAHLEYNAIARELSDYKNVVFDKSNSNVMLNGAIKFVVKFPAGITKLASLSIKAASDVFYSTNGTTQRTNTLTLLFEDCDVSKASQILTAYMMTSWQPLTLMKGAELVVKVTLDGQPCYFENTISLTKTCKFLGGECFVIDMSSKPMQHQISGSGTKSDPYLVYDPDDMRLISSLSKNNQTTYWQLCADVDMSGEAWTPAFPGAGHTKAIEFIGGGHSLKNFNIEAADCPSIFGELNGTVTNLTIENPTIKGTAGDCGVICGRLGSSTTSGTIKNVKILNPAVTTTLGTDAVGAAVFVGNAIAGTVENVTVQGGSITADGTSTVAAVGGVIGYTSSISVVNAAVKDLAITNNLSNTATTYDKASATGGIIGKITGTASIGCCSFTGGNITAPSDKANFIGGILGTGITAVTVSRCRSEFDLTARSYIGGVVGYLKTGSIYQCCYKGTISGREAIGGIVGYLGTYCTLSDCFTEGTYSSNHQIMGGIAGEVLKYATLTSCYSTAKLIGGRAVGGVIGRLANGGWTAAGTNHANTVNYCIAWNSSISATGTSSQAGSGAVVGYTGTKNSFTYCYRKANFSFTCSACPDSKKDSLLANQGQTTSNITKAISSPYWYPYHANDVNATNYPNVTTVVKYINSKISSAWDTNVWDLSGAYPSLIGVGDAGGSGGDTPTPKPGVNPGSDWTKTNVAEGIDYYLFHKVDAITGKKQCVHVTVVDMNSGKWALKLYYTGTKCINSQVFANMGAYASINGGYERGSIVIKQDNLMYYNMENDIISGTDVPNWKNEGSICFNEGLLADINVNAAGYEWNLEQQRKTYAAMPQWNIISSAPVLILNYEQLGTTFCTRYSGSQWGSDHETPASHQGSMYPRTAIGYTHDGYLLLVVNDGRFSSSAVGMSCTQLTKFMAKYFNPKDLINLDGGGSSTMCVKGCGDSSTHVVNHPCDNSKFDHAGERDVPTHFYIVQNQ